MQTTGLIDLGAFLREGRTCSYAVGRVTDGKFG
jgi:hypothetical protein